jgi:hypothetical protein
MSEPVAVLARTRRRQRLGWNAAKCCATAPPQEMPSTSAVSYPSWDSSAAMSLHSPPKR